MRSDRTSQRVLLALTAVLVSLFTALPLGGCSAERLDDDYAPAGTPTPAPVPAPANSLLPAREAAATELPAATSNGAARAWLGVVYRKTSAAADAPLEVIKVLPGSGAVAAGLRQGDRILGLGDESAGGANGEAVLVAAIAKAHAQDTLQLRLERSEGARAIRVVLRARPDRLEEYIGSPLGSRPGMAGRTYANAGAMLANPRLTLVDFWATYCPPCRATMPMLDKLRARWQGRGVLVVGLSQEPLETLQKFQKRFPVSYPLLRDEGGVMSDSYGVDEIPTLALLDQEGYVVQVWLGEPDAGDLDRTLQHQLDLADLQP
jgi:thiol-disulfide isomerase/thioredoxin